MSRRSNISELFLIAGFIAMTLLWWFQESPDNAYEWGRLLGFAEGADEAIVRLDKRFNQEGELIASWRNCVKERFGSSPVIGEWIDSITAFDSTDTLPAVDSVDRMRGKDSITGMSGRDSVVKRGQGGAW